MKQNFIGEIYFWAPISGIWKTVKIYKNETCPKSLSENSKLYKVNPGE